MVHFIILERELILDTLYQFTYFNCTSISENRSVEQRDKITVGRELSHEC